MKALILHLLENNIDQILSRSLRNCHIMGLDSIMLLETPGKTIRLYYAHQGHELHRNFPGIIEHNQSLSFHAHHCNLTLEVVKGHLMNWTVEIDSEKPTDQLTFKYKYNSEITNGKIGFVKFPELTHLSTVRMNSMNVGDYELMNAHAIHTVAADSRYDSAWLVYEGEEDPNYESLSFSTNYNLENESFEGLYQPMDANYLNTLINKLIS